MKNKIWILTLSRTYLPDIGGIETHIQNLVNIVKNRPEKYNFHILCFAPIFYNIQLDYLKYEQDWNISIRRLWLWSLLIKLLNITNNIYLWWIITFPTFFFGLLFYLIKHRKKIDIIHIQWAFPLIQWVILWKLFWKKIIFSTHLMYRFDENPFIRHIFKFCINICDKIICVSDLSLQEMKNLWINNDKLSRFVSWVNEDEYIDKQKSSLLLNNLWINKDDFIVLFAWRLEENKWIWLTLKAFELLKQYPHIKLLITWDWSYKDDIIKFWKNNKNIYYLWTLQWQDNINKYYFSDVFLFPTLYKWEASPLVIVESLMSELPVISSDIEIIRKNFNSDFLYLIEPTIDNIVNSILYFYKNPVILAKMKSWMKNYAISNFGSSKANLILDTYNLLYKLR